MYVKIELTIEYEGYPDKIINMLERECKAHLVYEDGWNDIWRVQNRRVKAMMGSLMLWGYKVHSAYNLMDLVKNESSRRV